jgi:hypothetical protein
VRACLSIDIVERFTHSRCRHLSVPAPQSDRRETTRKLRADCRSQERERLLRSAIDEGYSLAQIRQEISEQKSARAVDSSPSLLERFDRALKQAKKSRVWGDAKKQKKLEKLISQLEDLVEVEGEE